MVYCTSPVNVRDAASTGSNVIGMLSTGDAVERLGQEGGWVKILYEDRKPMYIRTMSAAHSRRP